MTGSSSLAAARVRPSGANATADTAVRVAGQWLAQPAGPVPISQVPQDNGSALAPDGHGAPVRGERHRIHLAGVVGQGLA